MIFHYVVLLTICQLLPTYSLFGSKVCFETMCGALNSFTKLARKGVTETLFTRADLTIGITSTDGNTVTTCTTSHH